MDEKNDYNEFDNQNNPYSSSQQSNYYEQQNQYNQSQQNQYGQSNYYSQQTDYQNHYNQRLTMPIGNNSMFLTNSQAERVLQ